MQEMSLFWLRVAAALYSAGILYVLDYLLRRSSILYRPALAAFSVAAVFHFVAIVEQSMVNGHLAAQDFHQTITLLALALAIVFLVVAWIYDFSSLGLVAFPLVALLTTIGTTSAPLGPWPNSGFRDAWLLVHVLLNIGGFTSTLFMALASVFYLIQEKHLKTKQPARFFHRLPPLHSLDQLANRAMIAGFVFTTLGVIAGSGWAYMESGNRWIGEGKVHISLFTWCFYLAVVFLRTNAGWRGRRAAFLAFYMLLFSTLTWVSHVGLRPLLAK
ncbi:MAG: cytochrome c biogenesis protein CcsA [Acidobacteria bacterium]|nr:cytochrome c biogenesis protein CcsA [Acidobacteriota bacterium]